MNSPQKSEPQRKQVTVLFADVKGYTAMSETMDAEDVTEIMNALWQRLDRIIVAQNGAIDKHIGDAIMAVWGTAVTREEDPERAIRAALEMQKELRTFAQERQMAVPLRLRIGINTGPALLGEVGTTGEFTAMGDTVNTASRLESAAPVGGILISHDTYRHVHTIFEATEQKPITVKGKAEPLRVYTITGLKPRAFHLKTRGIEGIRTPMIGRDSELEHLQDTFYTCVQNRETHVVTIVGEAGLGKSRLLYEFDTWLSALPKQVESFRGRAGEEMQVQPYALLRDLFANKFHIQDSDSSQTVWQKLEEGLFLNREGVADGRVQSQLLGELLGFKLKGQPDETDEVESPRLDRDLALQYLGDFFREILAQKSAIILLEDIQWADNSSLDSISHLLKTLPDQPLMLICLARPALFERRPKWGEGLPGYSKLELLPLTEAETRQLIQASLYKVDEIPVVLEELIVGNAQGNPFYVEELIKMLIEDKAIITSSSKWLVNPTRLSEVRIPPTLTGVLQARLQSLSSQEQTILQRAAVVGRAFWDELLSLLGEGVDPEHENLSLASETEQALNTLQARELITRQEATNFEGVNEFAFKNIILREVIYESVLKRERRAYHARVAEWLIERSGERKNEFASLIAEHLERAEQSTQAIVYLRYAGEHAQRTNAFREAISFFERALSLLATSNREERIVLTRQIGKALYELGQWDAAREQLQESLALAKAKADPQHIMAALQALVGVEEKQEKYAQARERLEESLKVARQYPGQIGTAQAENIQNALDGLSGAYSAAQARVSEGLAHLRVGDKKEKISNQLRALGRFSRKPKQEEGEEEV
jgi:class 3 adenylate cyclase/predicted ATPase